MSIYTIDRDIMALVDQETGEIKDWDAFESLQMDHEQKIENTALLYKNTVAEAAAIKAEEEALKKRREVLENRGKRLKGYLEYALAGEKFATPRCSITWRKNPPKVELTEPALVIAWAMNNRRDLIIDKPPEISKKGLAEVLKNGEEVPGATLVTGEMSMGVK